MAMAKAHLLELKKAREETAAQLGRTIPHLVPPLPLAVLLFLVLVQLKSPMEFGG